jgi:sarcosine oxidase
MRVTPRSWRVTVARVKSGRESRDVVVVGGGLLGLATAYALRGQRDVLVLEREAVGHVRGGSHGSARIFRLGYADTKYVTLAQRARERWTALEAASGVGLLTPTPQLTFGPGAEDVYAALVAAGAPVQIVTEAQISAQFPVFAGHGDAVFETASAVIAADRVLATLRGRVDGELREHVRVRRLDARHVETDDGVIDARTVVVCAGPWTRALVPGIQTTATLEHAAFVRTRPDLPIFIDFREPAVYGLPTPEADLYKIAVHHGGRTIDPDAGFDVDPRAVNALQDAIDRWLPGVDLVDIDVCPYDNTATEDFIVDRIDGIVVGAGTSGHGFKFGPLLGEQLAELVLSGE